MNHLIPAITAAVAGATAMYFLDPDQGKRRRALVRDKLASASTHTADAAHAQSRRFTNRVKGLGARLASHLPSHRSSGDPGVLERRVRSHLGHAVSHPKAVHVEVREDQCVCLHGHILADELEGLIEAVEKVPGVSRVDNQLMVHESAGSIPELQGGSRRRASRRSRFWRVLAVAAPVAIMAATMRPSARRVSWQPLRRKSMLQRLASDRDALPSLLGRRHRPRDYLSALRIS